MKVLDPNQSYTFSKIFELKVNVDELVKDFGYTFSRKRLNLPQYQGELNRLQQLEERIISILPNVLLVSEQLQGSLDYFLHNDHHVIVIEAKKGDLDYGFNQLATQLIALDQWLDTHEISLLGAVTTGNIWQFGSLNRENKHIDQGLESYRVPEDLELLMRILVQALTA